MLVISSHSQSTECGFHILRYVKFDQEIHWLPVPLKPFLFVASLHVSIELPSLSQQHLLLQAFNGMFAYEL
jgi:hypothetical protein